jgi:hypothetical protein
MTMSLEFCVSPEAPAQSPTALKVAKRTASAGLRLGLLDNSKSNTDHLLQFISESAQETLNIANVVKRRKPAASRPAEASVIDDLVNQTDFVIVAMGD